MPEHPTIHDRNIPKSRLELARVYGYAGIKSNKNLLFNRLGELVYFVAGTVIVEDIKTCGQRFFLGHNDDITCLAMHPKQELVASGQLGKAPYICIWNSINMTTISMLKEGLTLGIASVCFTCDGDKVLSVGSLGKASIIAWNWNKGKQVASAIAHSNEVFELQCHPSDNQVLVTGGVRHIKFWTISGNTLVGKGGVFGRSGGIEIQSIFCMCYATDGRLFSGTQNGDIYIWQNLQIIGSIKQAHPGGVRALVWTEFNGFISGGKDGLVSVWDPQLENLGSINLESQAPGGYKGMCITAMAIHGSSVCIGTEGCEIYETNLNSASSSGNSKIRSIVVSHGEGELWGLSVQPTAAIFATASDDCTLRLWNYDEGRIIARVDLPVAGRSCALNSDGSFVAAGLINGHFSVYSVKEGLKQVITVKDRKEAIHEIKYSPSDVILAVGSHDNFVDLYAVTGNYRKIATCQGASSYITHIDWSIDSAIIQVNSGGNERLFYDARNGRILTPRSEELAEIRWASWTCVLGPECAGIWEKYSSFSITDVNAADVNYSAGVIATADDFGLVKLFNFPCLKKGTKFRRYVGHSSHVTNIRFSHDNRYVFSTGGADHAIFQWRFIPGSGDKALDKSHDELAHERIDHGMEEENAYLDSVTDYTDSERSDMEVDSETERHQRLLATAGNRIDRKQDLRPGLKRAMKSDLAPGEKRQQAPTQSLVLYHAFGYRGYDCHQNVTYLQSGEIAYFVAAMGIVMNRETMAQRFYTGHSDDILCLAVHPVRDLIATGQIGRKPTCHVWDAQQPGNTAVAILQGDHTRGICAVDFSGAADGGRKLATIGMDDHRTLVLWDWKKGEKLASTRVHKSDVFVVRFNPFDPDRLITVGDKFIRFWKQVGGGFTSNRATVGKVARLDTMVSAVYGQSEELCFTGALKGSVYCWRGNQLERVVAAHNGPCSALHALDKGFVSGGKDGVVNLWDAAFERNLRSYPLEMSACTRGILSDERPPVRSVMLGHGKIVVGTKSGDIIELDKGGTFVMLTYGHSEGELWGLACHPMDGNIFATASDDRTIRVWSIATRSLMRVKRLRQAVRCIAYSPDGKLLAIGFINGQVAVVDATTLNLVLELHHRQEEISDIKFSPGLNKYVAVASHDDFVDIYNIQTQKRCGICRGSSSYVTHIDWDVSGRLLTSNSGAKELLYFEAPSGKRITLKRADADATEWSTITGVLGHNMDGIWPPRSDVTDVNASCVTSDRNLLATGDDFGQVKLFNYPAKGKFAKFKSYSGHSAHVTNVRWTIGDRFLISLGGADTAICIWALKGPNDVRGLTTTGGESEESDVESDDAGGYDSDVQYEKDLDYMSKIYANNLRQKEGVKPHEQVLEEPEPLSGHAAVHHHYVPESSQSRFSRIYDLQLEYIFGYRAYDCRQNVFFLLDTDVTDRQQRVVYHAAGAGIVLDLSTGQQSFYLEHDDDIISLAVNRNPKMWNVIATGQIGNEPTIHIWEATNVNGPQTLAILKPSHSKGVCSLDFSSSGRYLVSVGVDDPNFTISVWRWQDGFLTAKISASSTRIFRAEFRPNSETQLVSVGIRHLRFWQVAGTQLVGKRGVVVQREQSSSDAPATRTRIPTMLSLAFGLSQSMPSMTYTGSMQGDIYCWRENQLVKIISKAHSGPIFAMFTTPADGFIVTGAKEPIANGENTAIKLWDAEMNKCKPYAIEEFKKTYLADPNSPHPNSICIKSVSRIRGSILVGLSTNDVWLLNERNGTGQPLMTSHGDGELWGLAVHPKEPSVIVSASQDASVRVWDISKRAQVRRLQCPAGAQSCAVSPNGRFMAVGLVNGNVLIVAMNLSDGSVPLKVVQRIRDRGKAINDMKFSPDGQLLAVGGEDCCVDLYDVSNPQAVKRLGSCKGVSSYVNHLDFSEDGKVLRVSDGNYGHKYFSLPGGDIIQDTTEAEQKTWYTWSSVVGRETIGFWSSASQQETNSADVNCCAVSQNGTVVAAGDDSGYVRLASFPCSTPGAKTKSYTGHSAHVTNVQFAIDDSRLFSAGGDDSCIFVWKCLGDK